MMTYGWSRPIDNGSLVVFGSLVFLSANAVLALGFAPIGAGIVLAGTAASSVMVAKYCKPAAGGWLSQPIDQNALAVCLMLAVVLCILGGEGHFLYPNEDWLTRDAVLADLVHQPFPTIYSYQGTAFLLRAPLGMYLLPATVGRVLGLGAAHGALLVQNALLLGMILYLFAMASRIRLILFLGLFVAYASPNIVPAVARSLFQSGTFWLPQHLEGVIEGWQYSSHMTLVFWVPNHALPGWWFAALLILCARGEIRHAMLPIMLAGLCLWSPLAMIGGGIVAAPLLLRKLPELARMPLWWAACALAALFCPVLLYLVADAGTIPHGWRLGGPHTGALVVIISLFLVFAIPQLFVVWRAWSRVPLDMKGLLTTSAILLLVLPSYRMGPNDDLIMRGSIVPLAILAIVFCALVPDLLAKRQPLGAVAAALVVFGAVTPIFEVGRAIATPTFAISSCNVLTAWSQYEPQRWIANYMAAVDRVPEWLVQRDTTRETLRIEPGKCWPDHPIDPLPMNFLDRKNGIPRPD